MNRRSFLVLPCLLFATPANTKPLSPDGKIGRIEGFDSAPIKQTVDAPFIEGRQSASIHIDGQFSDNQEWVENVLLPQLRDTLKKHEMRLYIERRRKHDA